MIKNSVCELLNIEYPIFQGAMAWIADGHLAGHVSKAGGLGIIAGGGMPAEILREEIKIVKSITGKPFAVNLMLMMEEVAAQVEVCIEEGVPVVTTGAGNPAPYMAKLKAAGIKVVPVVPSVALAKRMEKIGADALIAEGTEAGGHIGQLTTMTLVPQVVDAVNIPVIAAGGIASGRQFMAALALGANAVQVGTRFIVAHECNVHDNYKNVILKAKDRSTVATGNHTGHPVRVINNKLAKDLIQLEKEGAPAEKLEEMGKGSLRLAVKDGDVVNGSVMAGQVASMICEKQSCQDIILDLMEDLKNKITHFKGNY
ncbi:enoyl-[acyl-carrier-protein] reductase FabK [uncultured Ilyobacter sp.]|uniref:enoyl-[acyl-carrier-protein] reductase FabK n=1 Tax=uncultured Ilyobacter sp. TaxID=544433 RepID=UPI0029F4FF28|nr:enoyl-[acyl-carrier-protein] reductase FabK [uncultured Ilyobacter sp.]